MVNDAESRYQLLERSDHVPEEANPNHFNKHDVQVLDRGWAQNISVPHGSKGCDDPVVCGDQIADEVFVLNFVVNKIIKPSFLIFYQKPKPYQDPEASKKIGDQNDLKKKP